MHRSDAEQPQPVQSDFDPIFKAQVKRLHQLMIYGRWMLVLLLWITLAPLSLWGWRYEIALFRSYFTWAALRYSIIYNPLPAIGLAFCIGITLGVIVWQSRNSFLGIPHQEQKRLEQQVRRICHQGASHPLWKWVCKL